MQLEQHHPLIRGGVTAERLDEFRALLARGAVREIPHRSFHHRGPVAKVPEPGGLILFGPGLAGLAAWRRLKV